MPICKESSYMASIVQGELKYGREALDARKCTGKGNSLLLVLGSSFLDSRLNISSASNSFTEKRVENSMAYSEELLNCDRK
jgi:hypothetical protein